MNVITRKCEKNKQAYLLSPMNLKKESQHLGLKHFRRDGRNVNPNPSTHGKYKRLWHDTRQPLTQTKQ